VSESNLQTLPTSNSAEQNPEPFDEFVVRVNRETREFIVKDLKTGNETVIQAKAEDETEDRSEPKKSLSVDEFRKAWNRASQLGLTWTTDVPPIPVLKTGHTPGPSFKKEYRALRKDFPNFPRELGTIVLHTLLHPHKHEGADEKVEIIKDLLTQEYRSEFFFKYAIKVPYFEDIDWEVVIKTHERGVAKMPKIAYALLMLTFRNPVNSTLSVEDAANEYREPEFITVAVNEELIDGLINKLTTTRNALEAAQALAGSIPERDVQEKEDNTNGSISSES